MQYSYDDRSVVVVNSYYQPFANMTVVARVLNLDMAEKFIRRIKVDLEEDSSTRALTLPEIEGLSSTYFVSLELQDPSDHPVSRNLYWLSTKAETLDWEKSTWYVTPTKAFADYTALNGLPQTEMQGAAQSKPGESTVTLTNTGKAIAFGVHLKVKKGADGDEVLPVLWEDNYFSLLPGETSEVTATYSARDMGQAKPVVEVEGWNCKRAVVK